MSLHFRLVDGVLCRAVVESIAQEKICGGTKTPTKRSGREERNSQGEKKTGMHANGAEIPARGFRDSPAVIGGTADSAALAMADGRCGRVAVCVRVGRG